MKRIKYILIVSLGLLLTAGCDMDFEEINDNPNDPVTVPSGLLTADVVRNCMNSTYSTFWGGDMGSCWAQHWAKVNYEEEARYKPRESVIEGTIWKTLYEDVISDAATMEELAIAEENDAQQAVALVLQAYGYSVLTEMFGDIPFSDAMNSGEGNFAPKYDTQQEVYNGIFAMLDQAESLFAGGSGSVMGDPDLIYSGSTANWRRFANSLKFRLLMRVSAKMDVSSELQDIVSNRPVFTSHTNEAKLVYLTSDPNANPMYESIVFGSRFEYKINSYLVDMLKLYNDPRLPVYAQRNSGGEYRGKPSGIDNVPNDDYNYDNVSPIGTLYLAPTYPGFFMSYCELLFLMAEAAHKGYISGNAGTYYANAVAESFRANGLSTEAYNSYIAQSALVYSANDQGLYRIQEQNWIALYCQGVESWTEWRRTKVPALQPAIEAVEPEIPSRLKYPAIEQSVNKANYDAAIAAQGPDLLTTKPWVLK